MCLFSRSAYVSIYDWPYMTHKHVVQLSVNFFEKEVRWQNYKDPKKNNL